MSQRQYYFKLQMDNLFMSNKELQCAMEQAKVKNKKNLLHQQLIKRRDSHKKKKNLKGEIYSLLWESKHAL